VRLSRRAVRSMNCEAVREQLEAYALGALEDNEARFVEDHVATCLDCRDLLDAYQDAASRLVDALPDVPGAPATEVKQRLMAQVTQLTLPPAGRSPTRPAIAPHRSRFFPLKAVAACLLLVIVGSSVAWGLQQRSALAKEKSLRTELEALVGQQEIVLEVVDSSRTVKSQLRAVEPGSTAYGKLYTRPDMAWVVALVGRLPPKPEEEVYNLWLTRNGSEQLAGPLEINENGFALILFDAQLNGPLYEGARVVRQLPASDIASAITVVRWEAAR
jgi:anti-sigma-K factor RskA